MKLDEGNVFEMMRLVLPEHRAVMSFVSKQQSKRERPILTEDQMEELQYKVSEAIEQRQRVRVKLFQAYENAWLEGLLFVEGNGLSIRTTGDNEIPLPIKDILDVQLM